MKKILKLMVKHKIASAIIIIIILGGVYYAYGKTQSGNVQTRYVLAQAEKGTLITSVSGSGQVSVTNQVEVKAKASGDVVSVGVAKGQEVKAGAILIQLNAQDALKTVRDAQNSLETAQLSLLKLKQPADQYAIFQSENSLTAARTSLEKLKLSQVADLENAQQAISQAEADLSKSYDDAFNAVAGAFLNLPNTMTKLHDVLYSYEIGNNESSVGRSSDNNSALINSLHADDRAGLRLFQDSAVSDYQAARIKYEANFSDYKSASRYSDRVTIENLLNETVATVKAIAQAAKSQSNYLDTWVDFRANRNLGTFATVTSYQSSLSTYISQTNSNLSSLLSAQSTLENAIDTLSDNKISLTTLQKNQPLDLAAAQNSVIEKENSLAELKKGTDPLDIRSEELTVSQRNDALRDARQKLADYTVRAPFDGIVAVFDISKGDTVSSGGAMATIITKQHLAEISLNEVDVAKVKINEKVNLTFDAVSGLNITGQVADIDAIGTVSQGVVTYNVKIIFDTQDDRIKSGMSVSANIITDSRQNVLMVPNSAVKSVGANYYVLVPNQLVATSSLSSGSAGIILAQAPSQQIVEIGLVNDTSTEIVNGLTEGEQIIMQTINGNSTAQTQTQGGGGNIRVQSFGAFGR